MLFHESDPGDTVHLIVRGRAAVQVATALGSAVTLDVLGPGDVVGELALLGPDERRSASVAALDAVDTIAVSRPAFDELRNQVPALNEFVLQLLGRRNRQLVVRLGELASVTADVRVLRRLLDVAGLAGPGASTGTISVPITQDDLAGLAATTRETVNRTLRRQVELDTLELSRGRVVVHDLERLRSAAYGRASTPQ